MLRYLLFAPLWMLSSCCLLPGQAQAWDAKALITGPQKVEAGSLVILDSSNSQGDVKKWLPPFALKGKCLEFGDKLVFATGAEGAYEFGLIVGDKTPTVDHTTWTVVVGREKPPEPPKPEPGPGPTPQPTDTIPAGSWITFVEETSDRYKFPHLAVIQADRAWEQKMKAKGLSVGWYDVDAKEVADWKGEANKAGLPALLVIDPKGKVIKAKTVPPTVASVEEFLFGGAK